MRNYIFNIFIFLILNNACRAETTKWKDNWPSDVNTKTTPPVNTKTTPPVNNAITSPVVPPNTDPANPINPNGSTDGGNSYPPDGGNSYPITPSNSSHHIDQSQIKHFALAVSAPQASQAPSFSGLDAATPPTTQTPATPPPAPATPPSGTSTVFTAASSAAYSTPVPVYCTNGKQMGLLAIKSYPIQTSIPKMFKGKPVLESTKKTPVPQGQIALNDMQNLCSSAGGPDLDRLKKALVKEKYDIASLNKIKKV